MKLLTRQMELGLNMLQLMYTERATKPIWSVSDLAEQLRDSELFAYRVLKDLKASGYVVSTRGQHGGYACGPVIETASFGDLLKVFNKQYYQSVILTENAASERAHYLLDHVLKTTPLTRLLTSDVIEFRPPGVA